ncbi:MAG: hypothetical protein Tsb002_38460 [Wenzhouxiangellaceae bacterium]
MATTYLLVLPLLIAFGMIVFWTWLQRRRGRRTPWVENPLRPAGASLHKKHLEHFGNLTQAGMYLVLGPGGILVGLYIDDSWIITILFSVFTVYALWKFVHEFRQTVTLKLALDGEVITGQELNYLIRDGAWVYHDLPIQYGNIDHIVVSTGGVMVVETKSVTKPVTGEAFDRQSARVRVANGALYFPHFTTTKPVQQVNAQVQVLKQRLNQYFDFDIPVIGVIALPGWYVEAGLNQRPLVINPKRGNALRHLVTARHLQEAQAERLAQWFEDQIRTTPANSKQLDPDWKQHFSR